VRVKNRERESQQKEDRGEPAGYLREDIGRLRAENIFSNATAERRPQALAFGALHQDYEHHQRRDEDVKPEEDIDQKGHWDGQYRQSERFVNGVLE
jgi:hypothetical protein